MCVCKLAHSRFDENDRKKSLCLMYILRALTYSICDDLFKEISQAKFHFENELFMIQTIKCSKNLNEKRK